CRRRGRRRWTRAAQRPAAVSRRAADRLAPRRQRPGAARAARVGTAADQPGDADAPRPGARLRARPGLRDVQPLLGLVDPSANPTRNRRALAAPAYVLGRARDSVTVPSLRPSQERRSPRRIPRRTYGRAHQSRARKALAGCTSAPAARARS